MAQPPILTLSNIRLGFGEHPLFQEMNLAIQSGDRICLVGRNGSGKSTCMKIMAGLVEPDAGERFIQPGRHIAYMEQDPDFSGFKTLFDWAAQDLPPEEQYRLEMAMEGVKLNADQHPEAASGGERRRAALVRMLASDADLLLLDEPTNHLDIEAIGWLENHLSETRQAFILISHDRAFLRALSKTILWVDRGEVRRLDSGFDAFEGWRDKVWEEEDIAAHKLNRLIKAESRWAVEGISARRKRNMGRVRRLHEMRQDRAERIRRPGVAKLEFQAGPQSGRLVIEARNISKSFGSDIIVRDFSLRVARGERIALVGPNGVGKTTLLKLLTGEMEPDTGTVRLGTGLEIAVFDQNREAVSGNKTLWANLVDDPALGARGKNDMLMVRGHSRHVVSYLKDFLFSDKQARSPVSSLSGGERARLLLARIMAKESNLLILDEPTNDLDIETLDLLQELLDDYDGTVLLVSHDRDFIDRVASTTILMEQGGKATVYAGGWSDLQAQRADTPTTDVRPTSAVQRSAGQSTPRTKPAVANSQKIERLEREMARLQAEITKLEDFLSDPDLFLREPVKFQKATVGLSERQEKLAEIEEAWLEASA